MKAVRVIRGLVAAAAVLVASSATGQPAPSPSPRLVPRVIPAPIPTPVPTLQPSRQLAPSVAASLRGPALIQKLNQQVTLEGYYYDGSIPMIVDDIARTRANTILPPEAYVPVTGALPAGLKSGDKIRLTAKIVKPSAALSHLSREVAVAELAPGTTFQVVTPSALAPAILQRLKVGLVGRLFTEKYAVLIAGGYDASNNHLRYWNDTLRMYNLLRNKGYPAGNIKVVYANGTARTTDMPVDYSATTANLQTVFTDLGSKMTARDTLYVMVTDHGGGFLVPASGTAGAGNHGGVPDGTADEDGPISEATYHLDLDGNGNQTGSVSFDEVIYLWGSTISDDAFKGLVASIPNYGKMIFQFNQCFSGGFLRDLTGPRRIVMSAASKTQYSWSNPTGTYEEQLEHYMIALEGGDAAADTNKDGKVSILEAYEYSRGKDTAAEAPQYEDDGVYPPHAGAMPAAGEGTLGAATFL